MDSIPSTCVSYAQKMLFLHATFGIAYDATVVVSLNFMCAISNEVTNRFAVARFAVLCFAILGCAVLPLRIALFCKGVFCHCVQKGGFAGVGYALRRFAEYQRPKT